MKPPALDPATVAVKTGTSYPEPFRGMVGGRRKRTLGDALGLTSYGVNLVQLPPGASNVRLTAALATLFRSADPALLTTADINLIPA